ncbi:MAG TPA: phage N-6-adenine-methyltransferase [Fervidobacterium sp.]|nr:phage N-6-adenine-methyltransferase [Fervidobacterium sp.]
MPINPGMMSSNRDDWETPQKLFDDLNAEFGFTLDPCASHENAKCAKYYTKEDDGLAQSWQDEVVFMNPPYGREIGKWVEKAYRESVGGAVVVCLLPARTDTRWFHDYILDKADEIRFIKGRLKFGESKNSAPFPSMIVVFNQKKDSQCITSSTLSRKGGLHERLYPW